jgi:hypothetical protein
MPNPNRGTNRLKSREAGSHAENEDSKMHQRRDSDKISKENVPSRKMKELTKSSVICGVSISICRHAGGGAVPELWYPSHFKSVLTR